MRVLRNDHVEKDLPRRDNVLLNFNEKDLRIVRAWLEGNGKDGFVNKH